MSTFVNTVDSVGDAALTDSIIDRSITELADNVITSIRQAAFRLCKALTKVNFVNVASVGTAGFYECTALKKAEFHSFVDFRQNAFYGCSALEALILRSPEQLCTCTSSFSSSKIASGTGYIYVPAALVDQYKAASGWSTYADQIRAIEDYPEVCDPYSWPVVFASIDNGTYKDVYQVGDLVPLDLGSEGVVNMQIMSFDTDTLEDGSGTAPITWISKELLNTPHRMNPSIVNNGDGTFQEGTGAIGGWEKCEMRAYLQETVKPLIPENVRSRLLSVQKKSISRSTASKEVYDYITNDEVWIPSYFRTEMGSGTPLAGEGTRRIKMTLDGITREWALRDAAAGSSFYKVSTQGKNSGQYQFSEKNIYFPLGFCT